jgi:hypothetical protein
VRDALGWLVMGSPGGERASGRPETAYGALHWRLLGPFRGGWALWWRRHAGRAGDVLLRSADGGVWKTTDAG